LLVRPVNSATIRPAAGCWGDSHLPCSFLQKLIPKKQARNSFLRLLSSKLPLGRVLIFSV